MRRLHVFLVALALLGSGCASDAPQGKQTFAIDVDAKSTPAEKLQFSAFYPGDIKVSGGDAIVFTNRSTEAPHTITFGVDADRRNQPPIIVPGGENPVVTAPCDIDDLPTPKLVKCSEKKLSPYDGEGYWNSGFLQSSTAAENAGKKNVVLALADDIPTGNYTYVCILHPFMNGSMQVVDEPGDRSLTVDVDDEATASAAAAREDAEEIEEPGVEEDDDAVTMSAGWGDKIVSVNRFGPADLEIDEGQSVTWVVNSPYEPHTVTFGKPEGDLFAPGGVRSGGDYTGGFANSGLFGGEGTPFAGEYSLAFPKAGTYEYTCILHPGMDGTVKVAEKR